MPVVIKLLTEPHQFPNSLVHFHDWKIPSAVCVLVPSWIMEWERGRDHVTRSTEYGTNARVKANRRKTTTGREREHTCMQSLVEDRLRISLLLLRSPPSPFSPSFPDLIHPLPVRSYPDAIIL